jgi:hypothetical protein
VLWPEFQLSNLISKLANPVLTLANPVFKLANPVLKFANPVLKLANLALASHFLLLSCANGSTCLYDWKTTCEVFPYATEHRAHGSIMS